MYRDMAIQYYNVMAKSRRVGGVEPTPSHPPLDLSGLDDMLDAAHVNPNDPGDPTYPGHGPQTIAEWTEYRDNNTVPSKDRIWYYDFAKQAMTAYYYEQMRGKPADPRWIAYADAYCNSLEKLCATATFQPIYHFSGGLWMLHDHDPATWPESRVRPIVSNYLNNMNGSGIPGSPNNHELNSREMARVADWLLDYWRMTGFNNESYSSVDPTWNLWGGRYHNALAGGENRLVGHMNEWLHEWEWNPGFPDNAPYSDAIDYAVRAIDPTQINAMAIANLGGFFSVFTHSTNIRAFHEDANYQTNDRRDTLLESIEWSYANHWFPPTGTPGAEDQYGAYNLHMVSCNTDNGVRVEHQECVQKQDSYGAGNTHWGYMSAPAYDVTPWHLSELAWAWRITGDRKYLDRFDRIFDSMVDKRMKQPFIFQRNGGKQYNQFLFEAFPAIIIRGGLDEMDNNIAFRCHWLPDGIFPYNTPAAVDPTDPTGTPPIPPPTRPPGI